MKITRHTAGNLSLQRISIAITLVYSIILSEEMQVSAPIFFDFLCKFFVNDKMGGSFYTFYIAAPIFPAMFFPEISCFFCFASNQPSPGDFLKDFLKKDLYFTGLYVIMRILASVEKAYSQKALLSHYWQSYYSQNF
ncbi:hypothetical protein [uncultured Ruminococcus sp.]|uniref:hypothetical protein n=1 Tax=uncultured Ruminococcus sp. TaxID=165186 RepID=UPI0026039540|nr:hypothetical protein [uncultured Ruminococcus sp.]